MMIFMFDKEENRARMWFFFSLSEEIDHYYFCKLLFHPSMHHSGKGEIEHSQQGSTVKMATVFTYQLCLSGQEGLSKLQR